MSWFWLCAPLIPLCYEFLYQAWILNCVVSASPSFQFYFDADAVQGEEVDCWGTWCGGAL